MSGCVTMPYVPSDLVHLEDYKILDEEGQINWFLGVCPSAFGTERDVLVTARITEDVGNDCYLYR